MMRALDSSTRRFARIERKLMRLQHRSGQILALARVNPQADRLHWMRSDVVKRADKLSRIFIRGGFTLHAQQCQRYRQRATMNVITGDQMRCYVDDTS